MAKKVLIIEDYPATVEMIIAYLEPQGMRLISHLTDSQASTR